MNFFQNIISFVKHSGKPTASSSNLIPNISAAKDDDKIVEAII